MDLKAQRIEYEAILSSGLFAPQSNPLRFLEYVCTRYFEGVSCITEYAIAVEALGRKKDFDPKMDAIVRVEAHRVRKRLSEYYRKEGAAHDLRLTIPTRSYLPVFVAASEDDAGVSAESTASVQEARSLPTRRWILLAAASVFLLVVAGTIMVAFLDGRTAKKAHATSAVQPVGRIGPSLPGTAGVVRIKAGSQTDYRDRLGRLWGPDRWFAGGNATQARYRRIWRTHDPELFLSARQGREFFYHIPLASGEYELRLYFAETYFGEDNTEGGGESSRMFQIDANGATLADCFDPLTDAGGSNTAGMRVFRAVSPAADGKLHLRFFTRYPLKSVAMVNAIEVVPASGPESDGPPAVRWVASDSSVYDSLGRLWQPDEFSLGGRLRIYNESVENVKNSALYRSERFGHFSYAIAAAPGRYSLTLHFSEHWFGIPNYGGVGGTGRRVFDVHCNGTALLRSFDILREAGGPLKAICKTFRNLKPNAQGKFVILFVPTRDYACVNALELVREGAE